MWGRWPRTQIRGKKEGRAQVRVFSWVSLNADFWSDRTPLHEAAYQGRLLHLRSLIAQGFHVDTLSLDRVSALHEACLGSHYACAKFLLDSGANVEAVSTDSATPLFNSCSSGSAACVRLMLQHGASTHTPYQLVSPLHEAAKKGHRECLELLLSYGAHIDMELQVGGTPLYSACTAQTAACVRALLCSGADVRIGCGQDSPLHAAVRSGGANVVDLLLDFGADGCCRNAEGKTPLDLSLPNSTVRDTLQKKRSLLSVAALSPRYSSKSGKESSPPSLWPLPPSQYQGLPSLSMRRLCPETSPLCAPHADCPSHLCLVPGKNMGLNQSSVFYSIVAFDIIIVIHI
ncbi:ankyrin repeat and SOCS box protein 11 isoform X1 [Trematomus bernacchii]|uniref:ankyrin repeat and SOCS box protein 11 isoform X1 n=1 Tax=Trematomus bernacchii TaxID=40690 RepID=UPI001469A29F|nr:ankyrin repeat and SOCS box protein 11 isoform X1 [Trematomus bernacchii]